MRLFVALPVPAEVAEPLLSPRTGLEGVRWQSPENLHVTLRFLGDTDRETAHEVVEALAGVTADQVTVEVTGLDCLSGQRKQPRAIVSMIRNTPPLDGLRRRVDRALNPVVGMRESRRFRPHVTLARIGRGRSPARLSHFLEAWGGAGAGVKWQAGTFSLHVSNLSRDGAIYEALETFPLRQAGTSP